jgi:hypothetical protein
MALLPTDAAERKKIPLWSGLMQYFPLTLIEVAKLSYIGNEQHNKGEKLHWAREKSSDQEDTLLRHLMEKGTVDTDGVRHIIKACWRCLASAELELEAARAEEKSETIKRMPVKYIPFVGGCSCHGSVSDPAAVYPDPNCIIHGE